MFITNSLESVDQVFVQLSHFGIVYFYKEVFFLCRKNKSLWSVFCTAKIFYHLWGDEAQLKVQFPNLHIVEPMGYLEFNYVVERAKAVVTDSGGITEETTVMGVPCITLRDNTERPETCTIGTNELIGTNPKAIKPALDKLFAGEWKKGAIPPMWDGHTAERIIEILEKLG